MCCSTIPTSSGAASWATCSSSRRSSSCALSGRRRACPPPSRSRTPSIPRSSWPISSPSPTRASSSSSCWRRRSTSARGDAGARTGAQNQCDAEGTLGVASGGAAGSVLRRVPGDLYRRRRGGAALWRAAAAPHRGLRGGAGGFRLAGAPVCAGRGAVQRAAAGAAARPAFGGRGAAARVRGGGAPPRRAAQSPHGVGRRQRLGAGDVPDLRLPRAPQIARPARAQGSRRADDGPAARNAVETQNEKCGVWSAERGEIVIFSFSALRIPHLLPPSPLTADDLHVGLHERDQEIDQEKRALHPAAPVRRPQVDHENHDPGAGRQRDERRGQEGPGVAHQEG